jgi:hypothetical protein
MNAGNTVTTMQPAVRLARPERSLCREHFRGHNERITNKDRTKHNQNPTMAGRQYAAFSLPNIC